MQFFGEKIVPVELFDLITSESLLPTRHLIKMTRVCRNWHRLVHAEDKSGQTTYANGYFS